MSTESIFHNITLNSKKEVNSFLEAIEKSKNIIPKNPVIKKDDEWRDETCWDELRKSLD